MDMCCLGGGLVVIVLDLGCLNLVEVNYLMGKNRRERKKWLIRCEVEFLECCLS